MRYVYSTLPSLSSLTCGGEGRTQAEGMAAAVRGQAVCSRQSGALYTAIGT